MAVIEFTLTYNHFTNQSGGHGDSSEIVPMVGKVRVIPQTTNNRPALAPGHTPPAGFTLRTFEGWIDTDGELKDKKGGTAGLKVWANDPVLGLDELWYKVEFNLTAQGVSVPVQGGFFEAPSTAATVDLVDVLETTGSTVTGTVRTIAYLEDLVGVTAVGEALTGAPSAAAARTAIDAQVVRPVGHYTPVGKPDGAVTEFDTSQTVYTFGGSVGQVVSEEIVHTPTGVPSATYYEMDAGARVRRMGCEVKWPPNALGACTLVLPITPWGPPGGHPSGSTAAGSVAGIHLSVFGNGVWYNSRWNVGSQTIYADYTTHGRFPTIWDDEFHNVEVWIDPEKGEGRLFVDGWSSDVFSDVTIADDTSTWAVWEQFNTNGASEVPCVIRNLWVDTQERRADTHVATRADIAEAIAVVSSDAYDVAFVTTTGGTTALTASSATMQIPTGTLSHTLTLPTTDVPAGRLFIVQNSSTGVITVNSSNGSFVTALASGGTGYFISVASAPTTAGNWLALPLVTINGVQTLTGKRLTAPNIVNNGFIADTNGNEYLVFGLTASAVNELKITNAATGTAPSLAAQGGDTNVDLNLVSKGTGVVRANGVPVITSTVTTNAQTGTTYTLALTDAGRLVTLNNAAAITLTVPPNSSVAFPIGTSLELAQLGAGQVTIAPGAGVTLQSTPGLKISAQYGGARLVKLSTDTWLVTGNLAA